MKNVCARGKQGVRNWLNWLMNTDAKIEDTSTDVWFLEIKNTRTQENVYEKTK